MGTSHSKDQSVTVYGDNIPWARQALCLRTLVTFFVESFLTSSNDCQNLLGCDIDFSDSMVFRITKVDEVLVLSEHVAHALRVMELCFSVVAIDEANLAITDLVFKLHSVLIDKDDSVVSSVSNNDQVAIEASLLFNANDLARVA